MAHLHWGAGGTVTLASYTSMATPRKRKRNVSVIIQRKTNKRSRDPRLVGRYLLLFLLAASRPKWDNRVWFEKAQCRFRGNVLEVAKLPKKFQTLAMVSTRGSARYGHDLYVLCECACACACACIPHSKQSVRPMYVRARVRACVSALSMMAQESKTTSRFEHHRDV